jgi:hypothetical protein
VATYEDQLVRIADLAPDSDLLSGLEFERCTIMGPAVIFPDNCTFIECRFAGNVKRLIWEVSPESAALFGIIRLDECTFRSCQFVKVGLALMPETAEQFRDAIGTQEQSSIEEPVA